MGKWEKQDNAVAEERVAGLFEVQQTDGIWELIKTGAQCCAY